MVLALKSSAIPGDYLIAAMSQAAISREVHSTALSLALADLGVVALTALGSFALASGALRPIGRMRAEVEAMVEKRNYGQVSVTSARDEVGRLGDTFNELLRALRDSQRSQQEFIAAAGHELRTPLAILRAELELATKEKRSEAEIRAAVAAAIAETDRLGRLSASLLNIARGEVEASARNPGPVAIGPALAGLLERMRAAFPEVTISDEISPEAVARCDEDELVQIAANLLDNAVRYSPPSSTVFIRGGRAWGWVTLEVDDEGGGIVGISTQQAIEPFVRGAAPVDGARRGSGLGLAIVTRLCQANGGDLSIGASDRGGTLVRVTLPDARLNLEESRHSRL
jgi:signal transduction histidine kinase